MLIKSVLTTIQLIFKNREIIFLKVSLRWDSSPQPLGFDAKELKKTAEHVFN